MLDCATLTITLTQPLTFLTNNLQPVNHALGNVHTNSAFFTRDST